MSESLSAQDLAHMQRALALAERGLYTSDPNPRVGCVVANGETVLGEGWHVRAGEPHAEVFALRAAGVRAKGASAYVTLEPCSHTGRTPPCADALIAAAVSRVICCSPDPNPKVAGAGIERLKSAGIEVLIGGPARAARDLNIGYFSRFDRGRPYVRLKMAMSLDGRTAPAAGGHRWISGEASRADVQTFRARSSAVLTGAATVLCDDPRLDVRLAYGPWVRQPLRVVLDTMLRCGPQSKIFNGGGALVFAAAEAQASAGGRNVQYVPREAGGLDLQAVMQRLTTLEVNELLIESGPTLAGAFFRAQLIDELVLYMAPTLLGEDAAPMMRINEAQAAGYQFEFRDMRRCGEDVRLILNLGKA